jgi:hypothetical protein
MCPPHAPSPRLDPPPPPSPRLAEAVTDELDRAAARAYRLQYQSYRRGSATGVIGEAPDDPRRQIALDEDEEDSGHASTSEAAEVAFNELLEWRLEYQAYRAGAAKGAKGRASGKKWPLETLRMLPVARLAAHVRTSRKQLASSKSCIHAHVGCGRLGLGLVVPSLAKGCDKIILVQRPSAAWTLNEKVLEDGSQIACCVNSHKVLTLEVCSSPDANVAERLATSQHGLLLLSTSERHMDAVASVATSSSVSLGPALAKGLEPLAAALRRKGSRLVCYAAENDHDAVERYAKTDVPFRLVPLLVDRVCTGRELTQREKGYVVDTTTEPWRGEIVVMRGEDDVDDGGAFPFGGEGVYRPPSAAAAQFLHRRKILTVNGTHTTLAFLTLAAKEPPPHKGLPKGDYELVRCIADEADDDFLDAEEAYRQVWCFAVARQLLLLFESDVEVAEAALAECDDDASPEVKREALVDALLSNARAAIERLGRGGDLTSRVLGAGVVKRYEGRLLPVAKFLECAALARSFMKTPLARLLLRKARLTETTLRLTVLGLTADAARFAEKTPDTSTPKTPPQSPRKAPKPPTPLSAKRRIQSSTNLFGMVPR